MHLIHVIISKFSAPPCHQNVFCEEVILLSQVINVQKCCSYQLTLPGYPGRSIPGILNFEVTLRLINTYSIFQQQKMSYLDSPLFSHSKKYLNIFRSLANLVSVKTFSLFFSIYHWKCNFFCISEIKVALKSNLVGNQVPSKASSLKKRLESAAWSVVVSFCQQTRRQFLGHQEDFLGHRVHFSGHQVDFSGHNLAGFQGTRWQTSGPRGPNIISTFMSVSGQGEGLGRKQMCHWICLSKAKLPS